MAQPKRLQPFPVLEHVLSPSAAPLRRRCRAIVVPFVRPGPGLKSNLTLLVALACGAAVAAPAALAARPAKVMRYHGYRLVVPRSWPVYRLSAQSRTCVRFDRHALYLGR